MTALQFALLGIQLLTGLIIAVTGYYARKYIKRIDRNTRFRRYIAGDKHFDSDGKLDRITDMHDEFEKDVDEIKESLEHTKHQLDTVITVLEEHTDVDPEDIDDPDEDFRITDDD